MKVSINNAPKFVLVGLGMVCVTGLMATGKIDEPAGMGLLGSMIGYATGNGIAARRNEPVEPLLGPSGPTHPDPDPEVAP